MKIKNYLIIAAAGLITLAGVSCTDLSSIEKDLDSLESRVTALETQIKTLNDNVTALQALRNATTIKSATHNTTENTWTVELSDGTVLTLNDGVIGEGKTPALSINTEGYWTVDYKDGEGYILVKDASGNPVKALGTDGKTPVFGVDANGYWTVDYGTGATQVKDALGNPVKASSSDAADSFFNNVKVSDDGKTLEVTLKDGSTYSLPIVADFWFKILYDGQAAEGSYIFERSQTKVFTVDHQGIASAVVIAKPSDSWTVVLEGSTLTVTAPAARTKAVAADSRTDIAILAISEKGFSTTAKISVALNDEPIQVNPSASVSFVSATETTLSFSVTATDFTGCKYVIKSDDTVPTAEEISTSGTAITFEPGAATATFTAEGLTGETTYKVFVLPYNGDVLGTVATAEGTTLEIPITTYYAAWEKGKDIVIGGVTYNKATWTEGEAIHLTESSASKSLGRNGIYFIDSDVTALYDYVWVDDPDDDNDKEESITNLIIIGNNIGTRSNLSVSTQMKLNQNGDKTKDVAFFNMNFDSRILANYPIVQNFNGAFDRLVFDNCHIILNEGKRPISYISNSARSFKYFSIENSEFEWPVSDSSTEQFILSVGSSTATYGTLNFQNNVIYKQSGFAQKFRFFQGKTATIKKVILKNNTLINIHSDSSFEVYAKVISDVEIENNLVWTDQTMASNGGFIRAEDLDNGWPAGTSCKKNAYYIGSNDKTWQAFWSGTKYAFSGAEECVKLTENPFEGGTFNLAEGKFVPNATYAEYGAKR